MSFIRRLANVSLVFLIAIDQLAHVMVTAPFYLIGVTDCPNEDETISGRVGRHALRGHRWALVVESLIDLLFWWQKDENGKRNHCRASIEPDEVKRRS